MSDVDVRPAWSGPDPVSWSQRSVDGAAVLFPVGELDADLAAELERRLKHLVESTDGHTVLIDLADADFIDACCVGVLLRARADARRRNRQLWVRGLRGVPALVFDALDLRSTLECPTPGNEWGGEPGER
jgi:anti-anti-sigma factor